MAGMSVSKGGKKAAATKEKVEADSDSEEEGTDYYEKP